MRKIKTGILLIVAVLALVGTVSASPVNAPEFPTLALPLGLIIGMLGVVYYIRETRQN